MKKWRNSEQTNKNYANISFSLRSNEDDLSYLDLKNLVEIADNKKGDSSKSSLTRDSISYTPIRNAVAHTGRLTDIAKNHLNTTFQNIKARLKNLLAGKN